MPPSYRFPSNAEHERVSALFLGPKAENFDIIERLFSLVLRQQRTARLEYFSGDQYVITEQVKDSAAFKEKSDFLEAELRRLTTALITKTVPFYSLRYSGHMTYDPTLPAIVGYLSTVLFNPNNVAIEASPFTTPLELDVGRQLCEMFGFSVNPIYEPVGWGHIVSGGTVANLEAMWAARNLKFFPLSLRDAIVPGAPLDFIAANFQVSTCIGENKLFKDLSVWELLNLRPNTILEISPRLCKEYAITPSFLETTLSKFLIQSVSKDALERRWGIDKTPQIFVASTKHYSWPKAAALTGVGSDNVVNVPVDVRARMNADDLRHFLEDRLKNQQAVYTVVATMGTTEEGAVDPLSDILAIRDEFLAKGFAFTVHADAAWGGYFASMVEHRFRRSPESYVPRVGLREETKKQLLRLQDVDSVTVDPHKAGYVPYPAGSLCYRDGRMRFLVTWSAPYLDQGQDIEESIGVYGVEGSKPGAAAAAVWLAHEVIGLNNEGYGSLLGQVSFTCRRFSSHWATMSTDDTDFIVVPFNPLPSELVPDSTPENVNKEKQFIRDRIINQDNRDLEQDNEAMTLLNKLGSDLNINAFACNFRYEDGSVNTDIAKANSLNKRIFEQLSSVKRNPQEVPFYITSTVFGQADYGVCATKFKERLQLEGHEDLLVLRNVVMSPFTTTHNFIPELMETFVKVVKKELKAVLEDNKPKPAIHTFVMQGTDQLYLVLVPSFHMAGGRYQIIITADLDSQAWERYRDVEKGHPGSPLVVRNSEPALLDVLISGGSFKATISAVDGPALVDVNIQNVNVVKQRAVKPANLRHSYPERYIPFYLYGTPSQQHIDHLLVMAPNAQFSAANVQLSLDNELSPKDLKTGLIVRATNVYERAMQPFPAMKHLPRGDEFFFHEGKELTVEVYRDPFKAKSDDRTPLDVSSKLATGTLKLGPNLYIDTNKLNHDYRDEQIQAPTLETGHMP